MFAVGLVVLVIFMLGPPAADKLCGAISYDTAVVVCGVPYTKKAGYVGISDLTVIGASAAGPGNVMWPSNYTAEYDKIHEVMTCSG